MYTQVHAHTQWLSKTLYLHMSNSARAACRLPLQGTSADTIIRNKNSTHYDIAMFFGWWCHPKHILVKPTKANLVVIQERSGDQICTKFHNNPFSVCWLTDWHCHPWSHSAAMANNLNQNRIKFAVRLWKWWKYVSCWTLKEKQM